jgi:LPXTG-motif cell wall-anchored protein
MSGLLKAILFTLALSGVPTGYVFYSAAISPDSWIYEGQGRWADGGPGVHGAPGPIMGAGLPVLLVAGGMWLVRRRREKKAS